MLTHSYRIQSRGRFNSKTISQYQIKQKIGEGGFATVRKAIHQPTGEIAAVKILNKNKLNSDAISRIFSEIEIQNKLFHQNIVRIYEVVEEDQKIYLFMEYCPNGELFDHIQTHGPLPQPEAAKIFIQILSALEYMHSQNIAHRDIKTQNIILDSKMNAKITDFGLAKQYYPSERLKTLCGSPSYNSPQIILKNDYMPEQNDIWCLGVTLYIMLTAGMPFDQKDPRQTRRNIINYQYYQYNNFSEEAEKLIKQIFTPSTLRPSIQDIKKSSFYRKYQQNIIIPNCIDLNKEALNLDSQVIKKICKKYHKDQLDIKNSVLGIKKDQNCSLYYLSLKSFKGKGQQSPYDLDSPNFSLIKKKEELFSLKLNRMPKDIDLSLRRTIRPPRLSEELGLSKQFRKSRQSFRLRVKRPDLSVGTSRLRKADNSPQSPKRLLDKIGAYKARDLE